MTTVVRVAAAVAIACAAGAAPAGAASLPTADAAPRGVVQQIGTYAALTAPDYTGRVRVQVATAGTTLGIGTFHNLSGELVLIDGAIWRVGDDGAPKRVPGTRRTPFVQAIAFTPQTRVRVQPGTACTDLVRVIDAAAGRSDGMVAVRLDGRFRSLQVRSVAGQRKPYPPLADVVAQQSVFSLDGQSATLVGFRSGPDTAGLSAPGLHLHGLTVDRRAGGHVLSCVTGAAVHLQVQVASGVHVHPAQ